VVNDINFFLLDIQSGELWMFTRPIIFYQTKKNDHDKICLEV
jgi:hypothetical protein